MSDPLTNVEIEDVLASIRRLVAAGDPADEGDGKESGPRTDRLVLTPNFRVKDAPEVTAAPPTRTAPAAREPWQDPKAQAAQPTPERDAPVDGTVDRPSHGAGKAADSAATTEDTERPQTGVFTRFSRSQRMARKADGNSAPAPREARASDGDTSTPLTLTSPILPVPDPPEAPPAHTTGADAPATGPTATTATTDIRADWPEADRWPETPKAASRAERPAADSRPETRPETPAPPPHVDSPAPAPEKDTPDAEAAGPIDVEDDAEVEALLEGVISAMRLSREDIPDAELVETTDDHDRQRDDETAEPSAADNPGTTPVAEAMQSAESRAPDAPVAEPPLILETPSTPRQRIEETIAELEAAVTFSGQDFEPDGSELADWAPTGRGRPGRLHLVVTGEDGPAPPKPADDLDLDLDLENDNDEPRFRVYPGERLFDRAGVENSDGAAAENVAGHDRAAEDGKADDRAAADLAEQDVAEAATPAAATQPNGAPAGNQNAPADTQAPWHSPEDSRADTAARSRPGAPARGDADRRPVPSPDLDDDAELTAYLEEESLLDEEALRDLVGTIVREELQGVLGERITRNVRKLVRREIHRILNSQEFD
ncbi:hypothetical protein [Roseisalinus antarcticus]|uniref:Uncharacterized protein n=1 Tax=Roseisalinus antarcticus TaxID=254357 RepID=A0A1Y5SRL8_9RHOB|nr:hypothetical protein [Roseisalinus antarcticus]SLN46698.1 hypothetical protein ROA7023_01936 [Roseisalinus antarcticus]